MSELPLQQHHDEHMIENLGVGDSSITYFSDTTVVDSTETDVVDLIDISRDKLWICYVHYAQDDGNPKNIKISHKRLKAFNMEENNEEYIPTDISYDSEGITIQANKELCTLNNHFDLDKHYDLIKTDSRFLSISPKGNYIALSCYKGDEKEKKNASCIIFQVKLDSIVYYTELKYCNGRVIILDEQTDGLRLAVIGSEKLVIYRNFSKFNKSPNYFYDLTRFRSSGRNRSKTIAHQELFIFENSSWAHINDEYETRNLMTFSRHIRYDVLVTPFVSEGIVRLWSIKDDGGRLTSLSAPNEHVIAISKDLKYAATIIEGIRSVKVYNIKNGLLVYTLQSRFEDYESLLEVTHVRFCYESRYLALSGLQKTHDKDDKLIKTEVVFEVWYIEAEKSIYGTILDAGKKCDFKTKTIKPFVLRDINGMKEKCLKGIYTFTNDHNENKIYYLELKIDEELKSNSEIVVEWLENDINGNKIKPSMIDDYEIENDITDYKNLKCANIVSKNKIFHIRFGKRMIQLWKLGDPDASNEQEKEDRLVYIRAYKGPSYGLAYSFRDTWEIKDFNSIRFIQGSPAGRVIVNIKKGRDYWENRDEELELVYHTEEIFLPLTDDNKDVKKIDYHIFQSACQALHYLVWCWKHKNYKTGISNWNEAKNCPEEEAEFMLTLKKYSLENINKEEKRREYKKNEKYKKSLHNLFKMTSRLIDEALNESSYDNSNYFATTAGSRTLAMLASFSQGREIIKSLLKNEASLSFSIFSYTKFPHFRVIYRKEKRNRRKVMRSHLVKKKNELVDYRNSPEISEIMKEGLSQKTENENILTVLIHNQIYDLYNLMFNRILSDSKKIGPGCLSSLADTLIFLQKEGDTDLLLSSSQKLSYLAIDINTLGVLPREKYEIIKVNEYDSKIRNLECHSTMEQLQKYDLNMFNIYHHLYYKRHKYSNDESSQKSSLAVVKTNWNHYIQNPFRRIFNTSRKGGPKDRIQLCVVPLPYFNTYNILLEDCHKSEGHDIYKNISSFVSIASDENRNNIFRQGDTVLEVMLQYKWRKFLRLRFIGVCLIHAIYYITYCTGVLFALELYGYKSEEQDRSIRGGHLASIICMSISGSLLLIQEIRQIIISVRLIDYLSSGYNWVDIAAFIFPLVTLLQLIFNCNYFYETCSVTTLILWLHAIIRLRVISFVGITLETIIQLSRKVWSILFIFLLVVFAFTHSFIVLLRQREDTYFQETYNGVTSMYSSDTPTNGQIPITVGNTTLHDISSDNGFADPFKAFYQVWLVIFGVWDPLVNGEAGDDKMVFFLCMLFALITVLIFTNMVIALMSSTVDEVKNKGNTVWVSHFASVVAEMEQLWCLPSTRRNRNNNPAYIYYTVSYNAVKNQEKKLKDETKELKKVLGINS